MDLWELKKLADTLDESGKQELIHFLQSRTKGMSSSVRAIDEIHEQKHKMDLFVRIVTPIQSCDLGDMP